jgi:hypothetical protein
VNVLVYDFSFERCDGVKKKVDRATITNAPEASIER